MNVIIINLRFYITYTITSIFVSPHILNQDHGLGVIGEGARTTLTVPLSSLSSGVRTRRKRDSATRVTGVATNFIWTFIE